MATAASAGAQSFRRVSSRILASSALPAGASTPPLPSVTHEWRTKAIGGLETANRQLARPAFTSAPWTGSPLPPLLRLVRRVSRVGAVRTAMARTHDPLVARLYGRGRPWTVLKRAAVARQGEAFVAPGQSDGAERASACSSNTNFALQPVGAVSALTTTSARAQSSSNARRSRTIESNFLPARRRRSRAGRRARRGRAPERAHGLAIGRQPLLGGEGVEALADDLERAVGVAHRRQIAGRRDDDVEARPLQWRRRSR